MKRSIFVMLTLMVLGAVVLSACGGGSSPAASSPTLVPVPDTYKGKTNPLSGNADAIAAGQKIFDTNCTSCHGSKGLGDGPAGSSLTPPPANLQKVASTLTDEYLFFRISEGGATAPFNSSMPAWKAVLKENEIWQVISYVKTLK
jgi:mono/diheme cytochrome c family protein